VSTDFEPWEFRVGADVEDRTQLIGYRVLASDGEVGVVDEVSDSHERLAFVVDTGEWVVGQRVLLPVGTVRSIDHDERVISVDRNTTEIKAAPPYLPDGDDISYRERLADYYCGLYD